MNENRSDKALTLLAQLSYIDEEHIAYADSYFAKRRPSKKPLYSAICTAAAVFIIMTFALSSVFSRISTDLDSPADISEASGIASVLSGANAQSSASPDLFTPCIVWQTEGNEGYSILKLTEDEIKALSADISNGKTAEPHDSPDIKMWICPGDGTVISPYLIPANGNTGISLFDYKPELIPSKSFERILENIVNERK